MALTTVALTGRGSIGAVKPGWSVQEDVTPVSVGDSSGSVGLAKLRADSAADSVYVANDKFALTHPRAGTWSGRVASVDVQGLDADLSVTGAFEYLNVTRTAPPVGRAALPGVYSSKFGSFGTGNSQFNEPRGIARDSSGNLYVVDVLNNRIQKFSAAGAYILQWGTPGTGNSQFNSPGGIAIDSLGAVYVVDRGNNRIQKFTAVGGYTLQWGSSGSSTGQFSSPQGIAIDTSNNIYVTDAFNWRVQKFTTAGAYVTSWGSSGTGNSQFSQLQGITTDSAGNVYTSEAGNQRVQKFTAAGVYVTQWGTAGTGDLQFFSPLALASYGSYIFVGDSVNNRVQVYTLTGTFVTRFGSLGTNDGQFNRIGGIVTDGVSDIWVTDNQNHRVERFTTSTFGGEALSSVFDTYLRLCDPTRVKGGYLYLGTSDPIVNFPGWRDKVWVKIKELCAAYHVQIDMIAGVATVSDIGSRTLTLKNNTPVRLSPRIQGGGAKVNVTYQNQTAGTGLTMYSAYTDGNKVYTVDVQQTYTITVQTNSHPLTLDVPQPSNTRPAPAGSYGIQDSTGATVSATLWSYYGGSIDATIGDVPGAINLTFTGPRGVIPGFTAPFSIASGASSTSDRRGELEVTGAGVVVNPQTIGLLTAADPTVTTQDVAQSINNVFLGTKAQAYDRGSWAVNDATGPNVIITFDIPVAQLAGFGLVTGSLITYRESRYRITNVTFGNLTASVTAVWHVTGADFMAAHPATLGSTWVALWANYTGLDFKIRPLRTS